MKIGCIADTHGRHKKVKVPECDVLVHAGDNTPAGELEMLGSFCKWFGKQRCKARVSIAGNHDRCLENELRSAAELSMRGCSHYLFDREVTILPNGMVLIGTGGEVVLSNGVPKVGSDGSDGLRFYGTP